MLAFLFEQMDQFCQKCKLFGEQEFVREVPNFIISFRYHNTLKKHAEKTDTNILAQINK